VCAPGSVLPPLAKGWNLCTMAAGGAWRGFMLRLRLSQVCRMYVSIESHGLFGIPVSCCDGHKLLTQACIASDWAWKRFGSMRIAMAGARLSPLWCLCVCMCVHKESSGCGVSLCTCRFSEWGIANRSGSGSSSSVGPCRRWSRPVLTRSMPGEVRCVVPMLALISASCATFVFTITALIPDLYSLLATTATIYKKTKAPSMRSFQ